MQSVNMRVFRTKEEKKAAPRSMDPALCHVGGRAPETATWPSQRARRPAWQVALLGCLTSAGSRVTCLPNHRKVLGETVAPPTGMSQDGRPTVCSRLTPLEEREGPAVCWPTRPGTAESHCCLAPRNKSPPTLIVRQLGLWHAIFLLGRV